MDRSVRVLHVDDEVDFGELTATYLERESDRLAVETVTSPEEALDRLDGDIDCIVSDYDMPITDGIRFLEMVREGYPDLPFILFTGKGSEEVASEALRTGATDYLRKGGTERYELLANRIENAVEQYRATRRAADLGRIRSLINDVNQTLIRADTRSEIETAVTEIVTDSDPYVAAWIGDVDHECDQVVPQTGAGVDPASFEPMAVDTTDSLPATAVRTGGIAVASVQDDDVAIPGNPSSVPAEASAAAVVPLVYDARVFGVLAVYTEDSRAFDQRERALLVEVGDDIAYAVHSVRTQQELERHNDLFKKAQDIANVGAWEYDVRTEDLLWTDQTYEIHGLGRDIELSPETWFEFYHPEDRATIREAFERALETGESYDVELRLRTTAGETRWVRTRGNPQTENGRLVRVRGTIQDVTDRKEREQRLEQISERIEFALEATDAYIYAIELETGEETRYGVFERIHGIDPESVPTTEAFYEQCVHPEDRDPLQSLQQPEVLQDWSGTVSGEYRAVRPDGEIRWVYSEGFVQTGPDGDPKWLVGLSMDVTDRKERERQLERQNERFDELASVISHDLQTPLATANGRLELAIDTGDLDHAERARSALKRLDELRSELAGLLRGEELVETQVPVDIGEIATGAWETAGAGPDATLALPDPPTVEGDPDALERCFENLLLNALEHAGSDVTVEVDSLDGGFYVADDGPGVSPDRDVFAPGVTSDPEGTGMGLASVRQVVRAHDWEIGVTDSEDGGARFEITGVDTVEDG